MSEELVPAQDEKRSLMQRLPIESVVELFNEHQRFLREALVEGVDYGTVEGIDKPFLFKSGAEKLLLWHQLSAGKPELDIQYIDDPEGVRHMSVSCQLPIYTRDGRLIAVGVGYASTMEPQYRWVKEFSGAPRSDAGWEKLQRKSGQPLWVRKVPNPDIARCYNVVMKMAVKRAFVDAALRATATSGLFTQDEELLEAPPAVCVGCMRVVNTQTDEYVERSGNVLCKPCFDAAMKMKAKFVDGSWRLADGTTAKLLTDLAAAGDDGDEQS